MLQSSACVAKCVFAGTRSLARFFLHLSFCAVALILLSSTSVFAQVSVWNGGNGDWNTAGNWTGGVPTSSSLVFIDNGKAVNSSVGLDGNGRADVLFVDSGDTLTIQASAPLLVGPSNLTV